MAKNKGIAEEGGKKALAPAYRNLWLLPATTVMVSCVGRAGAPNIITIAACGVASSNPPLISLAIGVDQYSLKLITNQTRCSINVYGICLAVEKLPSSSRRAKTGAGRGPLYV